MRQAVLADERMHDPGFFNLTRPAPSAVQSVDGRLRATFIGFDPPRQESIHRLQLPCGSQSFEAIDQFPAAFVSNDHDRRKLTIALQRAHHAAFEFGNVKTVSAVSFSDLVQPQFLRLLFGPAQHGSLHIEEERNQNSQKNRPSSSLPLLWSH